MLLQNNRYLKMLKTRLNNARNGVCYKQEALLVNVYALFTLDICICVNVNVIVKV